MAHNRTFVIVGAGLAGAKAAETLRQDGFDGRVLLLGDEGVRPYERPPLSKDYLRGEKSFSAGPAIHDEGFYHEHDIDLRELSPVTAIDPDARTVTIEDDERISYDALLLATGSEPRRLPVPGAELDGVHHLRSLVDADSLRAALTPGRKVVVIGSGWIGAEVAASAQQLGASVTMVSPESVPLERVLGIEVGAVYESLHAAHGIELHLGQSIERVVGHSRAAGVELGDGSVLEADVVVAGVGALPRLDLARAAGLELEGGGIKVDAMLQTSEPGIYAAGDIAAVPYPDGRRIRLEHWSAALNQGPAAARNMLGEAEPYTKLPYFFSDQWDLGMEYRGFAHSWDEVVFRGDPAGGEFLAFWLKDRRVLAAMNANIWDQADAITELIEAGTEVDAKRLAEDDAYLGLGV